MCCGGSSLARLVVLIEQQLTMDGAQGADLLETVGAGQGIAVHIDDYSVFRSPLSDFRDQVQRRGLGQRVTYVERDETVPLGR